MTAPKPPQDHDVMTCRACGRDERASEGYPCIDCGTFTCLICNMRGIVRCRACAAKAGDADAGAPAASSGA